MRRTLKENVDAMPTLYLNDSAVLADYPRHDMNNLRDILEELGAETDGIVVNGETFMVINGLDKETVLDEMTKHGIDELEDDEYLSYEEPVEDEEQMVAEDDDNSFEDEDTLNESEDILDDAKSELRGLLAKLGEEETYVWDSDDPLVLDEYFDDYDEQLEVYSIDAEGNIETQHGIVNAFELTDSDDIYSICDDIREMDEKEKDYPDYEDVEDEEDEQPRFEKLKHHRRLEEKKGGCCPDRRNNKLNEALKAHQEKDQKKLDKIESNVKKVLDDINNNYITMHDAVEALNKLKEENKKLNKIEKNEKEKFTLNDVKGVNKALDKIGQVNPTKREEIDKLKKLMDKVNESVDAKKKSLHENVQINGKSISKFSIQQLKDVMNKLNESDTEKYAKLINYLDEEITYRITLNRCEAKQARKALLEARAYAKAKALNEAEETEVMNEAEDGSVSDEDLQKMFGEPQGSQESEGKEDTKKKDGEDNEEEETEEVELTRIVITLKNQKAAEELKQACLDAEIPEDAIEIEEVKDEESKESSEDEEATEEGENKEENAEESEESEGENESYNYSNIRNLLFEGEDDENSNENSDENSEGEENTDENSEESENAEGEDTPEEVNVKLILTNTDYAEKLADVLDKVYGITKEEFEEMIGGEIVREGEEDEEATEEDEKEGKKDEESEESSADAYKPEELFQGL